MLGALVTGGLSLVSGLFGRSSAKKKAAAEAKAHAEQKAEAKAAADVAMATPLIRDTSTSSSNALDLKRLVSEAMANGFNPMSIINAGGLSSYTSTQTDTSEFTMGHNATAGLQAVLGVGAAPTANIPSVGSIVAGALSDGYQQYRSDSRENAQRASQAAGYFPPAPVPSFSDILRGGGTLTSATGQRAVGNSLYEVKQAGQTSSMPWLLKTDPGFADAEAVETEYGENFLVSMPYSLVKLGANAAYSIFGKTAGERHAMYADMFNATVSSAYKTLSNIGNAIAPAPTGSGYRTGPRNLGRRGQDVYADNGYVSVPQ